MGHAALVAGRRREAGPSVPVAMGSAGSPVLQEQGLMLSVGKHGWPSVASGGWFGLCTVGVLMSAMVPCLPLAWPLLGCPVGLGTVLLPSGCCASLLWGNCALGDPVSAQSSLRPRNSSSKHGEHGVSRAEVTTVTKGGACTGGWGGCRVGLGTRAAGGAAGGGSSLMRSAGGPHAAAQG